VAQGEGPQFKPQYHKKTQEKQMGGGLLLLMAILGLVEWLKW
jgi:hypothetical protein